MKPGEKTELYRELAKLTEADFHLDRSLTLLLSQKKRPASRAYLAGLKQGLAEGKSVAQTVRDYAPDKACTLDLALIEAGERSGKLGGAFNHLARYYSSVESARKKARGALVYPLILLHLAILLPELPAAIAGTSLGLGFGGRAALGVGGLWLIILGLWAVWHWLERRALTSPRLDRGLGRIPLIGPVRRHWSMARFCQVFHAGLLAALRMSEICRLAGEAAQSGLLKSGSEEAAGRIESSGEPLAEALAASGSFDTLFINSVATAEEAGRLDEEFARLAAMENITAAQSLERASVWLPKIGYTLIVLFVLYRIFSMLQAYYGGVMRQLEAI